MSSRDFETEIGNAWAAHRDSRHQDAINGFNNILSADPSNIDAYYGRGLAQRGLGLFDAALQSFEEGKQRVEQASNAYNTRTERYGKLKAIHEDAMKGFNQAIRALEQPSDDTPVQAFSARHEQACELVRQAIAMANELVQYAVTPQEGTHFTDLEARYNSAFSSLEQTAHTLQNTPSSDPAAQEAYNQAKLQYRVAMENFYDVFGPMETTFINDRRMRDRFLMLNRMFTQRIEETRSALAR